MQSIATADDDELKAILPPPPQTPTFYAAGIIPFMRSPFYANQYYFLLGKEESTNYWHNCSGTWSDFGGRYDRDADVDVEATAAREFFEESMGVVADEHFLAATDKDTGGTETKKDDRIRRLAQDLRDKKYYKQIAVTQQLQDDTFLRCFFFLKEIKAWVPEIPEEFVSLRSFLLSIKKLSDEIIYHSVYVEKFFPEVAVHTSVVLKKQSAFLSSTTTGLAMSSDRKAVIVTTRAKNGAKTKHAVEIFAAADEDASVSTTTQTKLTFVDGDDSEAATTTNNNKYTPPHRNSASKVSCVCQFVAKWNMLKKMYRRFQRDRHAHRDHPAILYSFFVCNHDNDNGGGGGGQKEEEGKCERPVGKAKKEQKECFLFMKIDEHYLEKQEIRWWSRDDLQTLVANGGLLKETYLRRKILCPVYEIVTNLFQQQQQSTDDEKPSTRRSLTVEPWKNKF